MNERAVKESLCELGQSSWLVADQALIIRAAVASPESTSWSDGHGGFYILSRASALLLGRVKMIKISNNQLQIPPGVNLQSAHPVDPNGALPLVYAPGRTHAVWKIGEAFLKVTIPVSQQLTREHITLEALKHLQLSFEIPKVLFHSESENRQYLIVSQVPGKTVSALWPSLDASQRRYCASRVADAIVELAERIADGDQICGIDGKHLSDLFLAPRNQEETEVSPGTLLKTVQALDMEQRSFLFYHCDLSPGNVLFTEDLQRMSVIDWETAGFVPREWIRSKLILSRGFDLDLEGESTNQEVREYATLVDLCLKEKGFLEVADRYRAWLRGSTT